MKYIISLYFSALFYTIGALTIENDANYSTWKYISAQDFKIYHQYLESLLKNLLFLPMGLALVFNLVLIFFKRIRRYRVWFIISALVLLFIGLYSLMVQVPLHMSLEQNYDTGTIQKLIGNHKTVRLPATLVLLGLNILLLAKMLGTDAVISNNKINA